MDFKTIFFTAAFYHNKQFLALIQVQFMSMTGMKIFV